MLHRDTKGISSSNKELDKKQKEFPFNHEERHRAFWDYIKEKDWAAAAQIVDRNVSIYIKSSHLCCVLTCALHFSTLRR